MKLLYINKARSIWILQVRELNPRGKSVIKELFEGLYKKYKFSVTPDAAAWQAASSEKREGLSLRGGEFPAPSGDKVAVDLTIHDDGFMADTRSSTHDSDAFLHDLLIWCSREFGLEDYRSAVTRKLHMSEMYVSLDRELELLNPKLKKLCALIDEKTKGQSQTTFKVGAIGLWSDPTVVPRLINFRLERAEGKPFDENRYYSLSPTHTDEHIEIIEAIEQAL